MATTTIDTKSLTDLITEFRKITAKDAITPENLGYILQRIADLLATAGTSETSAVLMQWYNAMKNALHYISSISQGTADRNHIYLNRTAVNPITGASTSHANGIQIQQATTERAGAMRAQQVIDLNAAKKNVSALEKTTAELTDTLAQLLAKLGLGDGSSITSVFNTAQISCQIVEGKLHILGAQPLVKAGYVPYLFRWTRKRNQFKDRLASPEDRARKKYCPKTKGWHVYGSCHAVKLSGTEVLFSTNHRSQLHSGASGYSSAPSALVSHHTGADGIASVGWGRSIIKLRDHRSKEKRDRMIRLRFAVGFAKKILPGKIAVTPANLVSSLAEFSLVYNPTSKLWVLSK